MGHDYVYFEGLVGPIVVGAYFGPTVWKLLDMESVFPTQSRHARLEFCCVVSGLLIVHM